jgi:hypothetical protein
MLGSLWAARYVKSHDQFHTTRMCRMRGGEVYRADPASTRSTVLTLTASRSGPYDAGPGLEKLQAWVLAINSADNHAIRRKRASRWGGNAETRRVLSACGGFTLSPALAGQAGSHGEQSAEAHRMCATRSFNVIGKSHSNPRGDLRHGRPSSTRGLPNWCPS